MVIDRLHRDTRMRATRSARDLFALMKNLFSLVRESGKPFPCFSFSVRHHCLLFFCVVSHFCYTEARKQSLKCRTRKEYMQTDSKPIMPRSFYFPRREARNEPLPVFPFNSKVDIKYYCSFKLFMQLLIPKIDVLVIAVKNGKEENHKAKNPILIVLCGSRQAS